MLARHNCPLYDTRTRRSFTHVSQPHTHAQLYAGGRRRRHGTRKTPKTPAKQLRHALRTAHEHSLQTDATFRGWPENICFPRGVGGAGCGLAVVTASALKSSSLSSFGVRPPHAPEHALPNTWQPHTVSALNEIRLLWWRLLLVCWLGLSFYYYSCVHLCAAVSRDDNM